MSVTDQYGDTLINGLLAGARFRGLQEDLKLSRLQRLEWEANAGFREQQKMLQSELGRTELSQRNQALSIGELEKKQLELSQQYAQEDRPLEVGRKKADLATSRNQSKKSRQDLKFAAREQPMREKLLAAQLGESEAATQSSVASTGYAQALTANARGQGAINDLEYAKTLGTALGPSRTDPDATDIIAALTEKGVDKKAMPVLLQAAYSAMEVDRTERDQNRQFLADKRAEAAAAAARDEAAKIGEAVRSGVLAADVVGRNPAALAGIEAAFADNPVILALARSGVTKQLDPATKEFASVLGDQYKALDLTRTTAEEKLARIKAGEGTYIVGSRDKAIKAQQAEVDKVTKQMSDLESKLRGLYKGGESSSTADSSVPVVTTQSAYDKLPKGARYREEPNGQVFVKQ